MTDQNNPRELIRRLVEIQDLYLRLNPDYVKYENDPGSLIELLMQVRLEAKSYLAIPEPAAGPTDGELWRTFIEGKQKNMLQQAEITGWPVSNVPLELEQCEVAGLRAVLARWGHQPPQPIPLSDRQPGPEDCDAEGRCWWGHPGNDRINAGWSQGTPEQVKEY